MAILTYLKAKYIKDILQKANMLAFNLNLHPWSLLYFSLKMEVLLLKIHLYSTPLQDLYNIWPSFF